MIGKKNSIARVAVALALAITLALGVVPVMNDSISGSADYIAQAATKKLSVTHKKIESGLFQKTNLKHYISVYKKKAKYTFKSNKKKIVSVNKKGIATAKKYGTAKITITEKYKKKTRKATIKVAVKKASIIKKFMNKYNIKTFWHNRCAAWKTEPEYTTVCYNHFEWGDTYAVINKNRKAKYYYYSNNKKILSIKTNGKIISSSKAGKVKITVKEKYKNKIRKVGTYNVEVWGPEFDAENTVLERKYYGQYDESIYTHANDNSEKYDDIFDLRWDCCGVRNSLYQWYFVCSTEDEVKALKANVEKAKNDYKIRGNDKNGEDTFTFAAKDKKVLELEKGGEGSAIYTTGVGTRYIVVFDATKQKPVTYMGHVKVIITKGELKAL